MLAPITIRLAAEMDPLHIGLAAATVVYGVTQTYFYQNIHKTLLEALRLKYENVDLVKMLTLQKERAEQANLAKSRFLAAASHDLRQPLHAQGLFLTELDYYVDHPRGRMILGGLESSVHAMARLFNALLDISKLDAGIVEPDVSSFRIDLLLQEIQQEFMPQAEELGINLQIVPSRAVVRSDQALLGSILRNFVSNALRYTHRGRVLLGCRRRGGDIEIQVWDTGIGIPSSQLKEIFQEFHQIGNPERDREKGLGLGLAIAKRTSQLLAHPCLFIHI
jgi:signal transduction histidine kinase